MDLTVWIFRNAGDRRFRIVFLAEPLDRIMHCLDRIGVRNIDNVGRHRAGRDIDALSIRVGRLQVKGDALLQIADIDIRLVNQPVIIVVEPPDRFTRRGIYAQTGRNGLEQDFAGFGSRRENEFVKSCSRTMVRLRSSPSAWAVFSRSPARRTKAMVWNNPIAGSCPASSMRSVSSDDDPSRSAKNI